MKILLVSYSYAPVQNPRAFRWTAITRHWVAQGHEVDVVCGSIPGEQGKEILEGVHVHRVPWFGLAKLRDRFKAREASESMDGMAQSGHQARLRAWALRQLRKLWKFVCWPDYACLWYPPASRYAVALAKQRQPELLISTSLPFTGQLVGLAVQAKLSHIPWLVDVGDPFSFREGEAVGNARLYRWLNVQIERRVFSAANAISVTTPGTAERYARLFAGQAFRVEVIPPLLSVGLARPAMHDAAGPQDGRIRLVFVGTLYRTLRSPDALLRLFSRLQQRAHGIELELHFYGNVDSCMASFEPYRESMGLSIHLHGQVPRETALAAMEQASVLVNIGNTSNYQLPSKLVEYLAMNKPIINLTSSPDDSSAGFLANFDAVMNIVQEEAIPNEQRIAEVLGFLTRRFDIDTQVRARQLQRFGVEQIAQDYLALARQIGHRPVN